MPYLQLELDAKKDAARVARLCEVHPGVILWGLAELWEHIRESRRDEYQDRRRVVVSAATIEGCFGIGGKLCEALATFGFIVTVPDGFDVKGVGRLFSDILTPAERGRMGGRKTASGGKSARNLKQFASDVASEVASEATPKQTRSSAEAEPEAKPKQTEALTPSTQHLTPSISKAEAAPPAKPPPHVAPMPPDDPLADGASFFAQVQLERAAGGLPREAPPRPEALSRWWSEMLMELNGKVSLVPAIYRGFATDPDPFWRSAKPPLPFHAFMKNWRKYVPVQPAR